MRLILLRDVQALGKRGDVVDVADGYARNFLLPRKLAGEGYHRGWPEEMVMSSEITSLVDKRWKEYGI